MPNEGACDAQNETEDASVLQKKKIKTFQDEISTSTRNNTDEDSKNKPSSDYHILN